MVAVDHSGSKQTRKFPDNVVALLVAFSGGSGEVLKRDYVGTGSGSGSFVVFFLKPYDNMSVVEAAELAKTALCLGVNNDIKSRKLVSGEFVIPLPYTANFNVFQVGEAGVTRVVSNDDIKEWLKGHFRKAEYE
ncbi:OLC1v1009044C1 [Oldenlandia corymbosa var. corymbosa]|uniref:OLC1v1009044C1 n=1 Tax=Oldenlandia corymbosa var. corymbosa TaxID=529605 RepID=A0AAV1DN34_OLDCO|nr:OLC1v1009044C1 [Oldenlandia corymbosa var. corymbosa]